MHSCCEWKQSLLQQYKQNFVTLTAKLDAMSPLKVLTRGYAMAQDENGQIVRSITQVQIGDPIKVSVSDGEIRASVTDCKEDIQ